MATAYDSEDAARRTGGSMAGTARKSKSVLLNVRVPESLTGILDDHIASKRVTTRSNESVVSELVNDLLAAMIRELKKRPDDFTRLLVAEAVREAALPMRSQRGKRVRVR